MSRFRPSVGTLLLGAIATIAVVWLVRHVEWVEREVDIPPSAEAARDPLLAASRLLERHGHDVTRVLPSRWLAELDDAERDPGARVVGEVVWVRELDLVDDPDALATLFAWVSDGGHLVAGIEGWPNAEDDSAVHGALLDAGVTVRESDIPYERALERLTTQAGPGADADEDETGHPWRFRLPAANGRGRAHDVVADLGAYPFLDLAGNLPARLRAGPSPDARLLVQRPLGAGWLTVLSSHDVFDNDRIGTADNGFLLTWLLAATPDAAVSVVVDPLSSPGLLRRLVETAPLPLAVLLVTLIAWLVRLGSRLGPLEADERVGGSDLPAHLRARADFWYRRRLTAPLLAPVREGVLRRLARGERSGGAATDATLDPALRRRVVERAKTLTGHSSGTLEEALFADALPRDRLLPVSRVLARLTRARTSRRPTPLFRDTRR